MALLVFTRPRLRASSFAQSVLRNSRAASDTNDHKNIRDYRGQNHVRCTRKSHPRPPMSTQRITQRRRDPRRDQVDTYPGGDLGTALE